MTIQHEQIFYSRMRRIFAGITDSLTSGSEFKYMRIESHMTAGVPDIAYSYAGHHGWLELKSVAHRKLIDISHFTPAQCSFLVEHGRIGGYSFLLIEVRDCPYVGDVRFIRSPNKCSIVLAVPWFRLDKVFQSRSQISFKRLTEMSLFVADRDVDIMYALSRCL